MVKQVLRTIGLYLNVFNISRTPLLPIALALMAIQAIFMNVDVLTINLIIAGELFIVAILSNIIIGKNALMAISAMQRDSLIPTLHYSRKNKMPFYQVRVFFGDFPVDLYNVGISIMDKRDNNVSKGIEPKDWKKFAKDYNVTKEEIMSYGVNEKMAKLLSTVSLPAFAPLHQEIVRSRGLSMTLTQTITINYPPEPSVNESQNGETAPSDS
jgi:hypothetical protein